MDSRQKHAGMTGGELCGNDEQFANSAWTRTKSQLDSPWAPHQRLAFRVLSSTLKIIDHKLITLVPWIVDKTMAVGTLHEALILLKLDELLRWYI